MLPDTITIKLNNFTRCSAKSDIGQNIRKIEDENAPRVPAGRLGARVNAEFDERWSGSAEYSHVFNQDKFASYEPHSFLMVINVDYQGKKHSWKWDTKEGRVTMLDSSIKSSGLELLKVEPMTFENALELKGELKFPDNFDSFITPKASGTLIKTYRTIGDKVSQGDLLATVQSQDLIRLNAERSIALDNLQFSRKKMEQERALFQKRVSPEIDYINAKREYDDAQTRANELNSLISSYGGSGNGTIEVRAAMSGTVLQVLAAVGSNVTPASPLFKIANTSQLLAVVNVPADKLNAINPNAKVTVKPQVQESTEEALGKWKFS